MEHKIESFKVNKNVGLSNILAKPVYDISINDDMLEAIHPEKIIIEEIETYLQRVKARMVSVRVSPNKVELTRQLESMGFYYVETILSFTVPLKDDRRFRKHSLFPIISATNADMPKIIEIACETFTENRFIRDSNFTPDVAASYYANWVESSFNNDQDKVYVLKVQDDVKGFYIIRNVDEESVVFLLAGVNREDKDSFYGLPLYAGVHITLVDKGYKSGEGEILAENIAVLNIFSFLGASFHSTEVRMHKWF